ncbi:GNAT family N-acetyltransferase [Thalassotalea euphylliae]|uniref:GNAT family N-acetyltransferase n=1 Tax=Thalassotalea euphylliae TaxID=1655234 RepID=UPI00363AEB07
MYRVTTDKALMNFDVIYGFISQSYWAKGIPVDTMKKAFDHSLCFAVLDEKGNQVGFARMITDYATFAYLADVFILETHRGEGLSKKLMTAIHEYPELQGLRRIMLATFDAHGLYEQFGYKPVDGEEAKSLMQIRDADVYTRRKSLT